MNVPDVLTQTVSHYLETVAIDEVMLHVARISAHDRYQASRGIEQAAELVADAADAIGLDDVTITRFPADGSTRWWSFKAPTAWTPLAARLEVCDGHERVFELDHKLRPLSLATYSAPTPLGGIRASLAFVGEHTCDLDLAGALCVVTRSTFERQELLSNIAAAGAVGLVTDARCRRNAQSEEYRGRIELAPDSPLFAFSVTSGELQRLQALTVAGAQARVVIVLDRSASMPVVTAMLPGSDPEELWLTAHLCHPRPGANDNASGVAALLGVAAAHARSRRAHATWGTHQTLRFIWGPEFAGAAAILHQCTTHAGARLPAAAINLDMVGENQALCGGPFVVERSPDCQLGLIGPIAEHVVGEVFARTRAQPGKWRRAPFMGFSDHALFADPRMGCPAVHLCHISDRFNHSAGDTLDKVSATEMYRATAAGAAVAQIAAAEGSAARPLLTQAVNDWCAREWAAAEWLAHCYRGTDDGRWSSGLLDFVHRHCISIRRLVDGTSSGRPDANERATGAPRLLATWRGPFNARAMMADLPRSRRVRLANLIATDRSNHALLLNFAIRVDGKRTAAAIVSESSYALGKPIAKEIARPLLDALTESGWVSLVPPQSARPSLL